MARLKIGRRTVLKGAIGGATVGFALPPLEAMFNANGTAYAADGAAIPTRMGVFFWGNGVRPAQWVPETVGATWTSPSLEPLAMAGVKEYVNVVSGTVAKASIVRGHHSGTVTILSGAPLTVQTPTAGAPYRSTFSKASIDQVAGEIIGKSSPFKTLEVGISTRVTTGEGSTVRYLSHSGPDSPNPPEYDPQRIFDRLFTNGFVPPNGTMSPPVSEPLLAYRKSVLDVVLTDINRLMMRVGALDRSRLDKHMTNVRSIENRLIAPPTTGDGASGCKLPLRPNTFMDQNGQEQLSAKTKAVSDLVAMALACNRTRVFSMMFTGSTGSTIFSEVGLSSGHHNLTHDERGDQPLVQRSIAFTVKMFAVLLDSLKAIPEGNGTNVLDSCAILASTDTSDGRFHSLLDYPILVAGRGGGYLRYPGIHYRSPSGENTSTVLLSVLRAAGTGLTTAGAGPGLVTSSCSAIEA